MYALERMGSNALIIGQAPAKTDDPAHPITGRTDRRLAQLMGMKFEDFIIGFDRANLIGRYPGKTENGRGDLFPMREAEENWDQLYHTVLYKEGYDYVLILGRAVQKAVGWLHVQSLYWRDMIYRDKKKVTLGAICPHPSGRSRWWNDPVNTAAATVFMMNWRAELCKSWERRANRAPARRR